MSFRRRLAFVLVLPFLPCPAWADTIVLKNGRRIVAEKITEEGDRVVYATDGGRMVMSLPRSLVERIDRDGALPPPRETPSKASPKDEKDGRPAGAGRGEPVSPAASGTSLPEQEALRLLNEGKELLRRQKYREARDVLLAATALAPESAAAWKALGRAEYALDRPDNAVRSWKEALRIEPDREIDALVGKAQREVAVEDAFLERGSANLTLRYEGGHIAPDLSRRLLTALEAQYALLTRDLGVSPSETVTVIVYTNQAFREATHAPSWGGGLFDGKVRVPLQGAEVTSPQFLSVLRHELTHSFVHFRSRGRAPTWLHEGLGQLEQGSAVGDGAAPLLQIWAEEKTFGLRFLEGPFGMLSSGQAVAAYEVSLATVQMLVEKNGFSDIGRLLDRLAEGIPVSDALKETYRTDYAGLEEDLAAWLKGKAARR